MSDDVFFFYLIEENFIGVIEDEVIVIKKDFIQLFIGELYMYSVGCKLGGVGLNNWIVEYFKQRIYGVV